MPIYEYRCQQCSHYLDVLQKISDDPLKRCPVCEAEALKRLISAPAFRLKGGGWYETDFKSDKNKRRNLADSGEGGGKSDSGGESKSGSESQPAEKSSNGGGSKSGEGSAKSSNGGGSKSGEGSAKPGDGGGSKSGDGSAKSSSPRSGGGSQSKAAV